MISLACQKFVFEVASSAKEQSKNIAEQKQAQADKIPSVSSDFFFY